MSSLNSISTTTVRLLGRDRITFRKHLVDWQAELDDLSLSESEALNAAVILINRAAEPKIVADELRAEGHNAEDINRIVQVMEWFNDEYLRILKSVSDARNDSDKRKNRKAKSTNANTE